MRCALPAFATAELALACGTSAALPPSAPSPLLGKALPAVRGEALDGKRVNTAEERRPVVVKFFADYCEPCKRTLPAAERLSREHRGVLFIGVSEDDYRTTAAALAGRYGLSFPVVHDGSRAFMGRFRVQALPITFVADSRGVVRWVGAGAEKDGDLAQAIDAVE